MANGLDILNAAKKQKQAGNAAANGISENKLSVMNKLGNPSMADLQNIYFGNDDDSQLIGEGVDYTLYPNGEKRKVYDAHEELKAIQSGEQLNNTNSKMPSAILESILHNPLNMPTEGMQLEENIMDSDLQNKTLDIINKLEGIDRKEKSYVQQPQQPMNESAGLYQSYNNDNIAQLIESIIDKKLKQYAGAIINESRKAANTSPQMKFMKLGDTFTFMDDANNVYECKMTYKGKGKVKTK